MLEEVLKDMRNWKKNENIPHLLFSYRPSDFDGLNFQKGCSTVEYEDRSNAMEKKFKNPLHSAYQMSIFNHIAFVITHCLC